MQHMPSITQLPVPLTPQGGPFTTQGIGISSSFWQTRASDDPIKHPISAPQQMDGPTH